MSCDSTVLPRCYALLAVTPPPPAPPLIFGRNYCIGLFYLHSTPPPPPPRGPLEPVCRTAVLHVYACCKCRKVVFVYQACRKLFENWSWPFSLISDGFLHEAVILPSRPVGGVWLRDYLLCFATCTWPTTLPSFSTATACRSKEFSSSTALQSTRIRGRGGGGLNCETKAQVLVVTPPPLFPESRSQKGGA